jgi:hypothetical protein
MEKEEKALELSGGTRIQISTRPWEIKTVKVLFAPPEK